MEKAFTARLENARVCQKGLAVHPKGSRYLARLIDRKGQTPSTSIFFSETTSSIFCKKIFVYIILVR
jgi:hypothetical protein